MTFQIDDVKYDSDKTHYVVVTGIISKEGKYLIAKRANWEKAFPNKWTVPGGKLQASDYKDLPKDTKSGQWYNICENLLKREVMEEVNLKIKNIKYVASLVFVRPDKIPVLVISMSADYNSGEIKLPVDLTDHAWVSLEESKKYDLIDGIYEEIEMVEEAKHGKITGEWNKK